MTKEDYQYLINLLHSSKHDSTSAINTVSKPSSSDTSHHMVSGVTKSGNYVSPFFTWILDSGASDHICLYIECFSNQKLIPPVSVKLPNGTTLSTKYSGTVLFNKEFCLQDVLFIPQFHFILISINKLASSLHRQLLLTSSSCIIQARPTLRMIEQAEVINNLYIFHGILTSFNIKQCSFSSVNAANNLPPTSFDLWHFRLGHPSSPILQQLCTYFPYISFNKRLICDCYHFAKQSRLPFPISNSKTEQSFALLHMDIWGPISIASIQGHHYFLTTLDDYGRYTWIYLLKAKSETRTCITHFLNLVSTQFSAKVKMIKTDNGKEFLMPSYYSSLGIIHQTSCVETPQQNSIVERKHRHLLNVTRTLLFQSYLRKTFWSYALYHSVHLINILPSPVLNNKTPFELLHNTPPTFMDLKIFGCLGFASTLT